MKKINKYIIGIFLFSCSGKSHNLNMKSSYSPKNTLSGASKAPALLSDSTNQIYSNSSELYDTNIKVPFQNCSTLEKDPILLPSSTYPIYSDINSINFFNSENNINIADPQIQPALLPISNTPQLYLNHILLSLYNIVRVCAGETPKCHW